jgi:hypothetical protein
MSYAGVGVEQEGAAVRKVQQVEFKAFDRRVRSLSGVPRTLFFCRALRQFWLYLSAPLDTVSEILQTIICFIYVCRYACSPNFPYSQDYHSILHTPEKPFCV